MSKKYNEEVRLQSLKEFVDEYANEEELTSVDGVRATIDIIEEQLNNYKKLLNSNPSEALECLNHIKKYYIPEPCSAKTYDCLETIKQALLKAQEPKQYLKWEDLEFKEEEQTMKVRMGNTIYKLKFYCEKSFTVIKLKTLSGTSTYTAFYSNLTDSLQDKQFFNDLRLERVEE